VSLAKLFLISSVLIFATIGTIALLKGKNNLTFSFRNLPTETIIEEQHPIEQIFALPLSQNCEILEVDHIDRFFALDGSKLPIVETISYTSRTPWLKDRPAWIADYAAHYSTSRHFIARSLNRKPDYFTQKISPGDRFNVFKRGKNIEFHLLVDLSKCKMYFYYLDLDANERVFLKTYRVGVGRIDPKATSGYLTPEGKYMLGDKIAIYKPGITDFFQNAKIEMVRVFGTRWIPFQKKNDGSPNEGSKSLGLHGAPWAVDPASGQLAEDRSTVGQHESDGCIRLSSEDIESLYAIIITKPTTIELVKSIETDALPGVPK
jgi:L,D-transpeptidase catalytic domain